MQIDDSDGGNSVYPTSIIMLIINDVIAVLGKIREEVLVVCYGSDKRS